MCGRPPPAPVKQGSICEICGEELHCRWTDTHGCGACLTCGAPYTLLHYDNNVLLDKPPALALKPGWAPLMKQYWQETKRNCDPGAFNFPGSSYEVATPEEFEKHHAWFMAHKDQWPQEDQQAAPEEAPNP